MESSDTVTEPCLVAYVKDALVPFLSRAALFFRFMGWPIPAASGNEEVVLNSRRPCGSVYNWTCQWTGMCTESALLWLPTVVQSTCYLSSGMVFLVLWQSSFCVSLGLALGLKRTASEILVCWHLFESIPFGFFLTGLAQYKNSFASREAFVLWWASCLPQPSVFSWCLCVCAGARETFPALVKYLHLPENLGDIVSPVLHGDGCTLAR